MKNHFSERGVREITYSKCISLRHLSSLDTVVLNHAKQLEYKVLESLPFTHRNENELSMVVNS